MLLACGVAVFALERIGYRLTMIALLVFMLGVVERKRPCRRCSSPAALHSCRFSFLRRCSKCSCRRLGGFDGVGPTQPDARFFGRTAAVVFAYAFAGCVIGTLVGVLPGLGPLAGISLLLPATYGLDPTTAGDARRHLLRRHVRRLDDVDPDAHSRRGGLGHDVHRRLRDDAQGRAGPALAIAAMGSYVAGTVSVVALMLLAPPLAPLRCGSVRPNTSPCCSWASGARVHERRLDAQGSGDGRAGAAAGHDRHRPDERLLPFQLRRHGAGRRHRGGAGGGRALRPLRNPADRRAADSPRRSSAHGCADLLPSRRSGASANWPIGRAP